MSSLLSCVWMGASSFCLAAEKVGFVNVEEIFKNFAPARVMHEEFEKETEKKKAEFTKRETQLKKNHDDYLNQQAGLSPDARRKREADLQRQMAQFQRDVQMWQQDSVRHQREKLKPLYDQLRKATESVAKAKSFGLILARPQEEEDGFFLYADSSLNMTSEVLKELMKATKESASSLPKPKL